MKDATMDLFNKRLLLVPIHLGTHWCLAAVNFRDQQLCYYDSLNGTNKRCLELLKEYIMSLSELHVVNNKWCTVFPHKLPQQKNHYDCGVFICMYARQLACNGSFNFTQQDIIQIRRHMVIELLFKKLL